MPRKKIVQSEENLNENEKQNTLKVEIVSNWSLLEILSDWKKVSKIIVALFVIVITIFIGLAIVTISIKRIYPYNDIKVNTFGATTMQNEETDVIYWLFNTADLWANSGIVVEKGDVLTIRASGRSHTAIHHLVEDATVNRELRDKWVGTDGEEKNNSRDKLRTQYRIFANMPQDALIMQVVPIRVGNENIHKLKENATKEDSIVRDSYLVFENIDTKGLQKKHTDKLQKNENFYFIGKEKTNLLIYEDGILHFAVNDIVLTNKVIDDMIRKNNQLINDSLKKNTNMIDWEKGNEAFFKFGPYPDENATLNEKKNEMTFYKETNYYNAWFDDNVGSFLIVIERKRSK